MGLEIPTQRSVLGQLCLSVGHGQEGWLDSSSSPGATPIAPALDTESSGALDPRSLVLPEHTVASASLSTVAFHLLQNEDKAVSSMGTYQPRELRPKL